MKVKICGIRTDADLKTAIAAGADAVGFLVGQIHASPDFILISTAARLAALLPPFVTPVLVTHLTKPEDIMEIVSKTSIRTVQLHGGSSLADVKKLSSMMPPGSALILAAHILQDKCTPSLDDYYPYLRAVLLDSYNKEKGQVGGTGQVHNWELSARIVRECPLPVMLAGGLTPDNVKEAIRTVRPYAVDANSGLKGAEGGRCPEKCAAFVKNANDSLV